MKRVYWPISTFVVTESCDVPMVRLPRDLAESLRDYLSQPLTASGMETHRAEADGMDDEYAALCEALTATDDR